MHQPNLTFARVAHSAPSWHRILVCACLTATLSIAAIAQAQAPQGKIVGWGSQVVGVDLSGGFAAMAAGEHHSLGLKTDGSIVAWGAGGPGQAGYPNYGQSVVPAPNTGFMAIAAGGNNSLAIRRASGDADGDGDVGWIDFAAFDEAVLGPQIEPELLGWAFYDSDLDGDIDIDLRDLAAWHNLFTGD